MRRLAVAAVVVLTLAGCYSRDERVYERAEQFFAQGQFTLAAEEYQRLAVERPRSALADDATYKLAYLYREELGATDKAIETYQQLADRYPGSPYADDSLLWVIELQGATLKDPEAVRQTLEQIVRRFPNEVETCARAHLQLVRTLMAADRPADADAAARDLLARYPQQKRQAAAAALVRARLSEKLNKPGRDTVALYQQVVDSYPGTLSAAEAKRALGWFYYGEHGKQVRAERLAKERAARQIAGVPAPAGGATAAGQLMACLRSLLAHRGVAVGTDELLALSGAAFGLRYSAADPGLTARGADRGILTRTAEQYGFAANTWSQAAAAGSFEVLVQSIAQGQPVMAPRAAGGWVIAIGYRPAEDRISYLPGQGGQPRTVARSAFLSMWASSSRGQPACVTGPYFQFALGQRLQQPTAREQLAAAAQFAVTAAGAHAGSGPATGLAAYDALTEQMQSAGEDVAAAQRLRQWATGSLPVLLEDRRAAAGYLQAVADTTAGAEAAGRLADLGGQLRTMLLSLTRPAQGAEPPPEGSWPEATDLTRQMRAADERLLDALSRLTH